jgi:hypothetical protein
MTVVFKPTSPDEVAEMVAIAKKVIATVDDKLAKAAAKRQVHFTSAEQLASTDTLATAKNP